jgi:chromosome segregation ATPase
MSQAFDEAVTKFMRALDAEVSRIGDMDGDVKATETRLRALRATDVELTAAVEKAKDELVAARDGIAKAKKEAEEAASEIQGRAVAAAEKLLADARQRARALDDDAEQIRGNLSGELARTELAITARRAELVGLAALVDTAKAQLANLRQTAAEFARG